MKIQGCLLIVGLLAALSEALPAQDPPKRLPESSEIGPAKKANADTSEALPTLDLKEYVITGREKVELDVQGKRVVNPGELRESVVQTPELSEDKNTRQFRTLGYKAPRGFELPDQAAGNSLQLNGGSYGAFGGGLTAGTITEETEFVGEVCFRRLGDHVDNAESLLGQLSLGSVTRLENGATVSFGAGYREDQYRFYTNPLGQKRTMRFGEGQIETQWNKHEEFQMHAYLGGEVGKIIDEMSVNGRENALRTGIGIESLLLGTLIRVRTDLKQTILKQGANPDILLDALFSPQLPPGDDLLYWRTQLGFERSLTAGFRITGGVTVTQTSDNFGNDINKIYPYGSLTKTLPGIGEIFGRYEPSILPVGLIDAVRSRPWLGAFTQLSHEYRPRSITAGWRKRIVQDLTWEVAYLYYHTRNRPIEVETGTILAAEMNDSGDVIDWRGDRWSLAWGNRATANGLQGTISWQANRYVRLFGNMRMLDYSNLKSLSGMALGEVPYHANTEAQFAAEIFPGAGFGLLLDGSWVGRRYADVTKVASTKLPAYLLMNVTLQKSIGEHMLISGGVMNLFNESYDVWRGYRAPDLTANGGFQIVW